MKEFLGSIFDIESLSKYLGISTRTVYRLVEKKELPGSKVGRQWRFEKTAIDQWLKEKRV